MTDTLLSQPHLGGSPHGKMLPILLHILGEGGLDEISITFDKENGVFVVNTVNHAFCVEHGCTDDDCRSKEHASNSMSFTDPNLAEYLDAVFHTAYND